jgi:hypothetical protein
MLEQVREEVGWEVRVSESVRETAPPTEAELNLVQVELDPQGMYR